MATPRFYVDTSAYLCVLLGETGNEALVRELEASELVSSSILALEVYRNLVRLARQGDLSAENHRTAVARFQSDLEQFALRDLTLDLCRSPVMPVITTPRSLDLAHLRTALWYHQREPLTRFVSLDQAQIQGATELGLPV